MRSRFSKIKPVVMFKLIYHTHANCAETPTAHSGQGLAKACLDRYLVDMKAYPEHVAISVWGTAAMRTHGDDSKLEEGSLHIVLWLFIHLSSSFVRF